MAKSVTCLNWQDWTRLKRQVVTPIEGIEQEEAGREENGGEFVDPFRTEHSLQAGGTGAAASHCPSSGPRPLPRSANWSEADIRRTPVCLRLDPLQFVVATHRIVPRESSTVATGIQSGVAVQFLTQIADHGQFEQRQKDESHATEIRANDWTNLNARRKPNNIGALLHREY